MQIFQTPFTESRTKSKLCCEKVYFGQPVSLKNLWIKFLLYKVICVSVIKNLVCSHSL